MEWGRQLETRDISIETISDRSEIKTNKVTLQCQTRLINKNPVNIGTPLYIIQILGVAAVIATKCFRTVSFETGSPEYGELVRGIKER